MERALLLAPLAAASGYAALRQGLFGEKVYKLPAAPPTVELQSTSVESGLLSTRVTHCWAHPDIYEREMKNEPLATLLDSQPSPPPWLTYRHQTFYFPLALPAADRGLGRVIVTNWRGAAIERRTRL